MVISPEKEIVLPQQGCSLYVICTRHQCILNLSEAKTPKLTQEKWKRVSDRKYHKNLRATQIAAAGVFRATIKPHHLRKNALPQSTNSHIRGSIPAHKVRLKSNLHPRFSLTSEIPLLKGDPLRHGNPPLLRVGDVTSS